MVIEFYPSKHEESVEIVNVNRILAFDLIYRRHILFVISQNSFVIGLLRMSYGARSKETLYGSIEHMMRKLCAAEGEGVKFI